jgi:arsenite methyltransferase
VDVVISNCVINLSADKSQVLREAFRVLRPGGRFAVSDIVVRGEMPRSVRQSMQMWTGCLAGALEEKAFLHLLDQAGFVYASIETTRVYTAQDARDFLTEDLKDQQLNEQAQATFASVFVRATKPVPE